MLKNKFCGWFYETEIWSMFIAIILQDGPFFIVRLICVVLYRDRHMVRFGIIFYMGKNVIMIALQIYRAVGLMTARKLEQNAD